MRYKAHRIVTGINRYALLVVAAGLWSTFLLDVTFTLMSVFQGQERSALDFAAPLALLITVSLLVVAYAMSRAGRSGAAVGAGAVSLVGLVAYWILSNMAYNLQYEGEFELLLPVAQYWDSLVYFIDTNPLVLQWLVFLMVLDLSSLFAPLAIGLSIASFTTRNPDEKSVGPLVTSRYRAFPALAIVGVTLQSLGLVLVAANIDALISPTLGFGFSFDDFGDLFSNSEYIATFALFALALILVGIGQAGVNVWIAGLVASFARDKGYSWALFFWLTWLVAGPTLMLIIAFALTRKSPSLLADS